ncbi:MAG: hypothetical protein KJ904_13225 [Alphaproteobacteria bacterium]|nr:hypothetical protein [Alphaproteobacteria bacterium]MBU0797129.1 hypothetical protein [Alphaproteobacteria bacterium]MBU0888116.1 hypothetical protein [Alphaproteobacteria bacterium]MBU1811561.1 hypothetical protein [Alphaproteobacteria bacterium]MBU2091864.1 hypothetical protein [Alphaproteobacteria bacterium]
MRSRFFFLALAAGIAATVLPLSTAEAVCVRNQLSSPVIATLAGPFAWEETVTSGYQLCTSPTLDQKASALSPKERLSLKIVTADAAKRVVCNGKVKVGGLVMLYMEPDGKTLRCDAY